MFAPPDPATFNASVYALVRTVPHGRVVTYGTVAQLVGPPPDVDPLQYKRLGARWVGSAMSQAPRDVPWQRVINAQGKISLRPGAARQKALLEAEGVVFDDKERVDLKVFGWPDSDKQLSLL